jgi:hypothetical protein
MKKNILCALMWGILGVPFLWGASAPFTFECKTKVIRDGTVVYESRSNTYTFVVEVIPDHGGIKPESLKWGKPFILAVPEERYSIRLHNPLPVRVGVNLTVDGLSSITAKPARPDQGTKWIIGPNAFVTIPGWQVSGGSARRFYFTSKEDSYAAWRSNAWGKDLSVNCGVIGAAYFWAKGDMEEWFERHPLVERTLVAQETDRMNKAEAAAPSARPQAGTGMGEKESHPVHRVQFTYDTGMYKAAQAVVIYYDFPEAPPRPKPFEEGYAPEQPAAPKR